MRNKIVIDVETGGFSPKKNGICEIAMIVVDSNNNIQETHRYVIKPYPRCPTVQETEGELVSYKDDAMAVHGITMDELQQGHEASNVASIIARVFNKHDILEVIGHNVSFDLRMIQSFLQRYEYQISMSAVCTKELSKAYEKAEAVEFKDHKLSTLLDHFGIENGAEHRAMGDAKATLELYKLLT